MPRARHDAKIALVRFPPTSRRLSDGDRPFASRCHFYKFTMGQLVFKKYGEVGFEPLSLVVKAANGTPTVKLSDNLAKATGRAEDIERFKRIFGYTGENYEECRY